MKSLLQLLQRPKNIRAKDLQVGDEWYFDASPDYVYAVYYVGNTRHALVRVNHYWNGYINKNSDTPMTLVNECHQFSEDEVKRGETAKMSFCL